MKMTAILAFIVSIATHIPELVSDMEALVAAVKEQGADMEAKVKAVAVAAAKALTDLADALDG